MVQIKVILALVAVLAPIVGAAPMPAAGGKTIILVAQAQV